MPKKGKLIEVYKKNFEGIGIQDIRIYLNKENGLFFCDVPKKVIKPCDTLLPEAKPLVVIETGYLFEREYDKIKTAIHTAVKEFKDFDKIYDRVILIKFENYTSHMDGSGRGLQLNWGVYRKYDKHDFVLESCHVGEKNKYISYQHLKEWKEVPYSDSIQDFLLNLDKTIDTVRGKLNEIINSSNFEQSVKTFKALLN